VVGVGGRWPSGQDWEQRKMQSMMDKEQRR